VGGPRTWCLRRGIAFAAVVALHAGLVITLTAALRTATRPSIPTNFVSTLIFLSAPVPPAASANRRRPEAANETAPLASVEPPKTPPVWIRRSTGVRRRGVLPPQSQVHRTSENSVRPRRPAGSGRDHCTPRRHIKPVSSTEARTASGLCGSATVATSSPGSLPLDYPISSRVRFRQGQCVRVVSGLRATCSKTCPRTRSITRSSVSAPRGLPEYCEVVPHRIAEGLGALGTTPYQISPCSEKEKHSPSPMMK